MASCCTFTPSDCDLCFRPVWPLWLLTGSVVYSSPRKCFLERERERGGGHTASQTDEKKERKKRKKKEILYFRDVYKKRLVSTKGPRGRAVLFIYSSTAEQSSRWLSKGTDVCCAVQFLSLSLCLSLFLCLSLLLSVSLFPLPVSRSFTKSFRWNFNTTTNRKPNARCRRCVRPAPLPAVLHVAQYRRHQGMKSHQ